VSADEAMKFRGPSSHDKVAEHHPIQHEDLQCFQQDQLAEEICLNWFPSLASDSITQGASPRASQWQAHPAQIPPITFGMRPTAVPLHSSGQKVPQPSLGEHLHIMLTWPGEPQLQPAFAPPTSACSARVRQSRPSNQTNPTQKTLHVGGLRAPNKRGYLNSATNLLPPREWTYQCRFCGRFRRSTSTTGNSCAF
jgi:hypothetical protein